MSTELSTTAGIEPTGTAGSTARPDGQLTALILGFFAAAWFGWAHGGAPATWSIPLTVGSLASLAVAVLGGVRTWRQRHCLTAANDRAASRRYGIIVGNTYLVIALGAVALGTTGHAAYVAPWVASVVGVHFWGLAPVLKDRTLIPLGVIVVAVALCAVVLASSTSMPASVITGAGTGTALLLAAVHGLLRRQS